MPQTTWRLIRKGNIWIKTIQGRHFFNSRWKGIIVVILQNIWINIQCWLWNAQQYIHFLTPFRFIIISNDEEPRRVMKNITICFNIYIWIFDWSYSYTTFFTFIIIIHYSYCCNYINWNRYLSITFKFP